ncbi:carcinoembryonic antigen-related cell adhesion molecule 5-like protein, partial [Lates japonicus]
MVSTAAAGGFVLVLLSVPDLDLQVQVTRSDPRTARAELKCLSSCPDGTASYI